jgi:glycosyltransferase involved in cell wall biosynthesis
MISRLERRRGVAEYAAAAVQVRERAPGARFLLAGPPGRESDALTPEQLGAGGAIEYLGEVDDVRPLLAQCHVYVYPSHGEGMPRSVLEAMACGRPIITSSAPGCRETVDEHVNGWLVQPGHMKGIAGAMETYLRRPDLIPSAASASRSKAERNFDQEGVNAALLDVLQMV